VISPTKDYIEAYRYLYPFNAPSACSGLTSHRYYPYNLQGISSISKTDLSRALYWEKAEHPGL